MRKLVKTALAALAATVFTAPAWAAIDVTGLNPWACYEFNGGDIRNTGSGERGWNGGGSSSPAPGATGAANTAVSINKWTNTGDVSTVGGLTVSLLATEGTAHSTADRNGHIFSLAAKGASGEPQWWLRNTGTTGQVKLQGVFTEDLTITLPEGSTDATFHHYVIAISGDRTQAARHHGHPHANRPPPPPPPPWTPPRPPVGGGGKPPVAWWMICAFTRRC